MYSEERQTVAASVGAVIRAPVVPGVQPTGGHPEQRHPAVSTGEQSGAVPAAVPLPGPEQPTQGAAGIVTGGAVQCSLGSGQ